MSTADAVNGHTITVIREKFGLPVAVRVTACGEHVSAVAGRVAPPDYARDLRHDDRADGHGYRAVQAPARSVVGPCERSGPCAECGRPVRAAARTPWTTTLDFISA